VVVPKEQIAENMQFAPTFASELEISDVPTNEELDILRNIDPDRMYLG